MKKYDVKFNELFESERDAVVSFLSLEYRHRELIAKFNRFIQAVKDNGNHALQKAKE